MSIESKFSDEVIKEFFKKLFNEGFNEFVCANWEKFKESKQPKPLITTEDCIEYYAGEKKDIFAVTKQGDYAYKIDIHPEYYPALSNIYDVFFSTKEAAQEYILYNKPCLSLSEVLTKYAHVGGADRKFTEAMNRLAKINLDK